MLYKNNVTTIDTLPPKTRQMSTYKKITLGNVNLYVEIEEAYYEVSCILIWAVDSHFFSLKECKDEKYYSTNDSSAHCCDCESIYPCLVS